MKIDHKKIGTLDCVLLCRAQLENPKTVVILCHGFGAPGQDLVPIGAELSQLGGEVGDALFVFPAAPLALDSSYDGRAWWMIDVERLQYLMAIGQTREMKSTQPTELEDCRSMIVEIIEWAKVKYSLPAAKIIVGGFSQGAMLATDVALNCTESVGGLILWSGALICEKSWQASAKKQTQLNVIQTHGRQDMILSLAGAKDLHDMLQGAGHRVKFREFNGPHTIPMEGIELAAELITNCSHAEAINSNR